MDGDVRYVGAKGVERAELVRALASAAIHDVCQALVDAAFFDEDAVWVRVIPILIAAEREERTKLRARYALDDIGMFAK